MGFQRYSAAWRRVLCWGMIVLLCLALLVGAAWFVVFRVNHFTLEILLHQDAELTLEYGESYLEPGGEVVLKGSLFWKNGIPLREVQLQISGEVDSEKLGQYPVTYTASYHDWHAQEQRTVRIRDTQAPVITLVREDEIVLEPGMPYQEAGFQAVDNHDGDLTDQVIRTEMYGLVTYTVTDSSGNFAKAERKIPYYDLLPPEIYLNGSDRESVPTGRVYHDPGYFVWDNVDGDLTWQVVAEGEVNWLKPGTYPITYTVTDAHGNAAAVTRYVEVTAEPRPEIRWPERKTVYLTFDDGPGPYTEQLLDVLDQYGVKATFFVMNTDCAEVMKQITQRGHSIGIHSVTHTYEEIYASPEAYFDDLFGMQEIIYAHTGVKTTLMRFPGGSSNAVSRNTYKGIMTILTEAVQDAGFQYFDWNVDSNDAGGAQKTKTVRDNVIEGIQKNDISIVLQHDIHGFSVDAVESIIQWGLNNGYTFLPLIPDSPPFHHWLNN